MKLTATTLRDEFDKMLVMRPISKVTPQKEALVFEDWQTITEHWEEGPFKAACFEVRKAGGFFPSIKDIESSYWQAVRELPGHSDTEEIQADYRLRIREHNETWSHVSASKDFPWILEQATDEVDAALGKLESKDDAGHVIMDAKGQLARLLRRHREESIRGRACEIYKENWG